MNYSVLQGSVTTMCRSVRSAVGNPGHRADFTGRKNLLEAHGHGHERGIRDKIKALL